MNNKIELYKLLGAEIFQKIVFKVEEIKYFFIEKFLPNIDKWYYKKCDNIRDKKLLKTTTEEERKKIIEKCRSDKLKFKKELVRKENRNYHLDINNIEETINYLKMNKQIHKRGLIGNGILTTLLLPITIITSNIFFVLFTIYQLISAIINFECINLQNYNLCRLNDEKTRIVLEKVIKKNKDSFEECMSEGKKVIGNSFRNSIDIPSKDDIINNINSKEEAVELLLYLRKHLKSLENSEKRRKIL